MQAGGPLKVTTDQEGKGIPVWFVKLFIFKVNLVQINSNDGVTLKLSFKAGGLLEQVKYCVLIFTMGTILELVSIEIRQFISVHRWY